MSKSPYYDIEIASTRRSVSKFVSSFTYEDCVDEDDLVKFTMHDIQREFIDATDFVEGSEIVFQFGYLSYKITSRSTAVIKTITTTYGQTIDIEVVALDKGSSMKGSSSSKIWKNQKASDIVSSIVSRYGLNLVSNPTTKVYENMPQGNRSDFEFIRYLTTIEEGGSYIFYIKDTNAYFVKRDLKKQPAILFQYGDPSGGSKVLSFKVTQKDTGKDSAKKKTTTTGIDPLTKEEIKEDGAEGEAALGDFSVSSAGSLTELPGVEKSNTTGKNVPAPVESVQDAKNVASKAKNDASLDGVTATLTIEGDTLVKAGDIIGIFGVGKKHEGNWYVKKVKHTINGSGFITVIELQKNATKQAVTKDSEKVDVKDVNDKTGSKTPNDTKTLLTVKADGSIVDSNDNTGKFVKIDSKNVNKFPGI